MSIFDLNNAETGGAATAALIPENTVARAILTIRPGGAGEGGFFKQAKSGSLMLDTEWTITDGPFARRKIWRNMMMTGNETAVGITMRQLRAAIEGHFGIKPDDMSEAAQAKRRISIEQLQGIEACILIGIEKQEGYEARNSLKAVVAPGERNFIAPGATAPAPAHAAPVASIANPAKVATPPSAPATNKPAWAV